VRVSETLPLLAHSTPEAPVAYRAGVPIPAWQFVADAQSLAARLPPGAPVLNACADRYHFAVGLSAAMLAAQRSLLPPTHTPEVIRHLRAGDPSALCLTDQPDCRIELPQLHYPAGQSGRPRSWQVPQIPAQRCVADVYTSGSTGLPVPHRKHFGALVRCVRAGAQRLGIDGAQRRAVLATVPPQHMYGLETSVLLSLHSGDAFCAERPFHPAEICATLAALPAPRVLVSTPVHLRALLAARLALPAVERIVSATAPLSLALAQEVEQDFGAPLYEIYGSTESGQIANRRPTQSRVWQLFPDVVLSTRADRVWAGGGHIDTEVALGDTIEVIDAEHFLLGERLQDLVNIAGKRNSIAYLNHQLLAIPGVLDGAFFQPAEASDSHTGVARLSALVVAPGLDAAAVIAALRERIDPVFLPRPLLLVPSLPRNSTGKLPAQTLRALLAAH
jgi:acyl-coenzyme A synthetase/AMP-(fatty) acid ligase